MLWLAYCPFMSLFICYETAYGPTAFAAASGSTLAANSGVK